MTTSVKEQLEILAELQAIDSQIYDFRALKEQKPLEIESLKNEFERKKVNASEAENNYKSLQVKNKEMDIELQQREANINKLQAQLFLVKTNKEYAAMQKEIEGYKADKAVLEETILEFMDKVEGAKKEVLKHKQAIEQDERKLQEEKIRIEKEIQDIDKKIEELEYERKKYLPRIEKKVLEKYERILKSKNGLAITSVKDDACQACFMHIRPQVLNEIQMKEGIVVCENCSRILYAR